MIYSTHRTLILLLFTLLVAACTASTAGPATSPATVSQPAAPSSGEASFAMSVLTTGLASPWEIVYGPDDYLWVTERTGQRVLRVDPESGKIDPAVTIDEVTFRDGQAGLQGMALHPELLQGTGNDYVYVAYSHYGDDGASVKIRRYTYDSTTQKLIDPVDILNGLPAGTDHNGGRLIFGPDGKLYYSMGDLGANNLANYCLPSDAQTLPGADEVADEDWRNYVGKILRIDVDGSIPADNPEWDGVRSHVYTVGHRNPQGLATGGGQLYATEHGPKTDDEINRIEAGQNFGWPYVAGYQDDKAYVYAEWSDATLPCSSLTFSDYEIPDAVPQQEESAWTESFTPPLLTFGTVPDSYNFQNPACRRSYYICWPTVAPSGMDYYAAAEDGIPGWGDSLLVAALKTGTIYRLPLSTDGDSIDGDPIPLFGSTDRYRDLAIGPDHRTFYVITDSGGNTQDPAGLPTNTVDHPGAILVFSYTGD